MKKIAKITNIALIFMLIGAFLGQDFAYSINISGLRVPVGKDQTQARLVASMETIGIRRDDQGHRNEKPEYLVHLKGDFPESLARHSLDWPVDMASDGYIWHFHESLYKFTNYSPRRHQGVDILFADKDESIKAILDGEIIDIIYNGGRPYGILVRSENGLVCCYNHIAADKKFSKGLYYYEPKLGIGQKIKKGQLIGKIAWCPRPLRDYKELDREKEALPFAGSTLATRLHFQTWYFPLNMTNDEIVRHVNGRMLLDKGDKNEFNPLLVLKSLYSISLLQEQSSLSSFASNEAAGGTSGQDFAKPISEMSMEAIIDNSTTARTAL